MVIIRLLELNKNQVIYEYLPEGQQLSGRVALDRITGERILLEKAEDYSSSYAFHAWKRMEEYAVVGEFKKEDIVAWY